MKIVKVIADADSSEPTGSLVDGYLLSNYAQYLILLPAKEKDECPCLIICEEATIDDLPKNSIDRKYKGKLYKTSKNNWVNISKATGKKLSKALLK